MGTQVSIAPKAIPTEVAERLCQEIREENGGKWYSFNGLWCLGCVAASKEDPAKRCWHGTPDNRGCAQVNARYDRRPSISG